MNYHKFRITFVLITLFQLITTNNINAQKLDGFEIDASIQSSDIEDRASYSFAGKYNYWLNPYVGFSFGGMVLHSKIDLIFKSPKDDKVYYNIDDNSIINFNGILGLKLSTPIIGGFGVMSDFNFVFEPIPFNAFSIDKKFYDISGNLTNSKSKNMMIFTHFNPSYLLQLSVFYEIKKDNTKKLRFALGSGMTNYNPYNTYYHAKVDDVLIRDHMKLIPQKPTFSFFFRITRLN